MKKLLSLLFLALLSGYSSTAQTVTLKANILSPVVSTGSFFGEYAFSPNLSAQLGFFSTGIKVKDTRFDGFGITPEVRYFFSGHAPTGFYGAGYLRFQDFDLTREDTQAHGTLTSFGGGALLGFQFKFAQFLVADVFLGPGFNAASVKGGGGEDNFNLGTFGGFSPRGGITVGIAF
ncbi:MULTISPECIES: DUF3575 domain-containing protein [Rufibacter]|uniref:DUF3575 domain-containing protein n=1 Tax=Rufibacter quisquiliarum TaxID=1549639 RepID=A0A839GLY2_9BACT|nr:MULTISPECIES: DUF3575 domain-containing protein [Rufibacter]MBA9075986.1 hypothetical protein [Rufibacter quisquiliarum]